ncbi:MAG: hypothetical protein P1Q69_20190 [Candidatus Thorarchaeota archaeon]|nr:hypothetical protein [Candidatus Thorarchaeota archaeon]
MNGMKTDEDFYLEVLSLLSEGFESERLKELDILAAKAGNGNILLSDEQVETISQRVADFIEYPEFYNSISTLIAGITISCNKSVIEQFEKRIEAPTTAQIPDGHKLKWLPNVQFEHLRKLGAVTGDEKALYSDLLVVHFGDRLSTRIGNAYLTNKRILIAGNINNAIIGNSSTYRLCYPDLSEKAFYGLIDFLDYHRISELKNNWGMRGKYISFNYETSYLQEKGRTLYGPLFFKMDLPTSTKVKQGQLKIDIIPLRQNHPTLSEGEFRKKRQDKLYELLNDAIGSS